MVPLVDTYYDIQTFRHFPFYIRFFWLEIPLNKMNNPIFYSRMNRVNLTSNITTTLTINLILKNAYNVFIDYFLKRKDLRNVKRDCTFKCFRSG